MGGLLTKLLLLLGGRSESTTSPSLVLHRSTFQPCCYLDNASYFMLTTI